MLQVQYSSLRKYLLQEISPAETSISSAGDDISSEQSTQFSSE